ncbi:YHS domain-containing (seleno)protein [Sphingorhabdus arenilitoris]|uniref:YHS domain-containing (Seleno)protein n=1 Tax=Sphingorhabdus arenilitoris TaxID=1490041 RepID=A0ABV8REV1_9SPHN
MKTMPLLIALLATAAACSNAGGQAAAQNKESAAQTSALAGLGGAPKGPIYTKEAGETLALSGYDAVSYFNASAPMQGKADYTVRYQGYDYRFANADNAKTFEADPAKYAPQYGGYCAWAIGANDALAPGDPNVYKIVDGKLYLNFNKAVAQKWAVDIPGFISKGDINYAGHDADEHYTN